MTDNAFLFDAATVEVDHSTIYSVEAPPGTFRVQPLVAEFRVRRRHRLALVSVLVDPPGGPQGFNVLADVFRTAVRE